MSRTRCFQLRGALYLSDNSGALPRGEPGHDPFHKIQPLLTNLSAKFQEEYEPSSCFSIDESRVRFKERESFKQYMPMKPIKRGFEVSIKAHATTGFVCQFEVYTGKKESVL